MKRRLEVSYFSKVNAKTSCSVEGCINYTVQNVGDKIVYIGFSRDSDPDIALPPDHYAPFSLSQDCDEWEGEVWMRFGPDGGSIRITKTM